MFLARHQGSLFRTKENSHSTSPENLHGNSFQANRQGSFSQSRESRRMCCLVSPLGRLCPMWEPKCTSSLGNHRGSPCQGNPQDSSLQCLYLQESLQGSPWQASPQDRFCLIRDDRQTNLEDLLDPLLQGGLQGSLHLKVRRQGLRLASPS